MFILHSSNLSENLLAHLSKVIESRPLENPFEPELFLIQSQGMERWLAQQLASDLGVMANMAFLFPAKFFNRLAQGLSLSLKSEAFDREAMVWVFESLLRQVDSADLAALENYLKHQVSNEQGVASQNSAFELKRFYLAKQLAQLFDQYQMMRPDMLQAWLNNELQTDSADEVWQKALWQQVVAVLGNEHRGVVWQALISALETTPPGELNTLPSRIHLFGLNTLPPLFLKVIEAISRHIEVHLYLLSPTEAYWGDAYTQRFAMKMAQPDLTEYSADEGLAEHHPLLRSLGQQGREFQEMLLTLSVQPDLEIDSFEAIENPVTILETLQASLYENQPLVFQAGRVKDASIAIHACHTPWREVQVLKNALLAHLAENPSLAWRDVVVMAPDIQAYAPFIETVFADIPHAIADKTLQAQSVSLEAFQLFLQVIQGRFGWESILDLLSLVPVYQQFDIQEEELAWLEKWILETRIRWGKSAEHKAQLGFDSLPGNEANTWKQGLDRMMMGFMLGEEAFIDDLLPYTEIEGMQAQLLGKLYQFIQFLSQANALAQTLQTRSAWQAQMTQWAGQLLSDKTEDLTALKTILLAMYADTETQNQPVSLAVMTAWMKGQMDERKNSSGFLRGQLTFCSLLPMRSIPLKVIALLGMNEGAFPKIDKPLSFDLMSQYFRPGDRSRRADERYQFLEILMSVRKQLIITYCGQSAQNNAPLEPSVVVSELIEQLRILTGEDNWITHHPLHAFSALYFAENQTDFVSYDAVAKQSAEHFYHSRQTFKPAENEVWWQGEISAKGTSISASISASKPDIEPWVALEDFMRFWVNPQAFFVKNQLDLRLQNDIEDHTENEPFSFDTLENYLVDAIWVEALKTEVSQPEPDLEKVHQTRFQIEKAQGRWPLGAPGELLFAQKKTQFNAFITQWQQLGFRQLQPNDYIDFTLGTIRVSGALTQAQHYTNAWVVSRYAKLKGKDVMTAWLVHLIQHTQVTSEQVLKPTYLVMKDKAFVFQPLKIDQAWAFLEDLMAIYQQGQQAPSDFFTQPAWAWWEALDNRRNKLSPFDKAIEAYTKDLKHEPEWQLLFGETDADSLLNEEIMETVMLPMKACLSTLENAK